MEETTLRRKPSTFRNGRVSGSLDWIRESSRPVFLSEVADWESWRQRLLFQTLLPIDTLVRFDIDPITLTDAGGQHVARMIFGGSRNSLRLEVRDCADALDPMFEMELSDTTFNQIEVVWVAIQDPRSPRFDIDVMPDGQATLRGVARRNLEAEAQALAAGLAPGQIRRGLDLISRLIEHLETFLLCLNQRECIAQPLYYHTAVLFERLGFGYIQGQARMERITEGFKPGGVLSARMDGSTPFRAPELAGTIRGRSWAIHDGILEERWDRVRMVKRLGVHARVNTCPDLPW